MRSRRKGPTTNAALFTKLNNNAIVVGKRKYVGSIYFPMSPTIFVQYPRGTGFRRVYGAGEDIKTVAAAKSIMAKAKKDLPVPEDKVKAHLHQGYCVTFDFSFKSTTVLSTFLDNGVKLMVDGNLPGQVLSMRQIFQSRSSLTKSAISMAKGKINDANGSKVDVLERTARVQNLLQHGLPHTSVCWSRRVPENVFARMKWWQRLNHFPGRHLLGHKDSLSILIETLKKQHPQTFNFVPKSFVLRGPLATFPEMAAMMKRQVGQDDAGRRGPNLWIRKPFALSQGRGIHVFDAKDADEALNDVTVADSSSWCVVQKYITNPFLVDGKKFDLRVYVLVASFNPLVIYIYDDGIAKFCTSKFDMRPEALGKREAHLANQALNKHSDQFILNDEDAAGSRWTHRGFWGFLQKQLELSDVVADPSSSISVPSVSQKAKAAAAVAGAKQKLDDLVVATFAAAVPHVVTETQRMGCEPNVSSCFEVYGLDVELDDLLTPHLLEVNVCPELMVRRGDKMSMRVVGRLCADVFHLVGLREPPVELPPTPRIAAVAGSSKACPAPVSRTSSKPLVAVNKTEGAEEIAAFNATAVARARHPKPRVSGIGARPAADQAILSRVHSNSVIAALSPLLQSQPKGISEEKLGLLYATDDELWQLYNLEDQMERSKATQFRRVYPCSTTMERYHSLFCGTESLVTPAAGAATKVQPGPKQTLPRLQAQLAVWEQALRPSGTMKSLPA